MSWLKRARQEYYCPSGPPIFWSDVVPTVASLAVMLGSAVHYANGNVGRIQVLGVILALLASLPVAFRRQAPVPVLVITMVAPATLQVLGYPGAPPMGAVFTLYWLARTRTQHDPWSPQLTRLVAGLLGTYVAAYFVGHGVTQPFGVIPAVLFCAIAWSAGERTRLRRAELNELKARAVRAEQEAQRDRRLALAEERTRIARDLHDSAAHAINVIGVQAGAARLQLDQDRDRARRALETIEEVARQTVTEIDQLIHGLREDASVNGAVEPPAGLAALGTLIDQHRGAGMDISLQYVGDQKRVTPNVDRAAYRILQEALTNSARHGSGGAAVRLEYGDRALELEVSNRAVNGHGTRPGGGHGLLGMRERALLLGGELDAAREGNEFRVHARLPYGASA